MNITKHGVQYVKQEPYILFAFYASGFGRLCVVEEINTVARLLNKPIDEICLDDIMTHPYAILEDEETLETCFINDYEVEADLVDCSPWYNDMNEEELNEWRRVITMQTERNEMEYQQEQELKKL